MSKDKKQPIIKKVKKVGHHGHHGGAWKIAYADFVTAMMAFFLLMWLINATSEKTRKGIANYFSPNPITFSDASGGGMGVMGGESVSSSKQSISSADPSAPPAPPTPGKEGDGAEKDKENFEEIRKQISDAIKKSPELQELAKHLLIEETPEGLKIQIMDQDGKPMFPSGSSKMYPEMEKILRIVGSYISTVPNKVNISGHTDAAPYTDTANYSNWELSSDRAHASRRVLVASGLKESRIQSVVGKEAKELLLQDQPIASKNRRICILLLKPNKTPSN